MNKQEIKELIHEEIGSMLNEQLQQEVFLDWIDISTVLNQNLRDPGLEDSIMEDLHLLSDKNERRYK